MCETEKVAKCVYVDVYMCTHVCTCMPCGYMCLCVFPVSERLSVSIFMYVSMCISMPKESCSSLEARTKGRPLTSK